MSRYRKFLLAATLAVFVWSGIRPHDYFTWVLEVFPVVIGGIVLWLTRRKFPLTDLSYTLIAIHAAVLAIGGHSTYALAPIGEWMKDLFGFSRNNYDKIGHFMQGFGPAIWVREILIRTSPLKRSTWLHSVVIAFVLAGSAVYEFVEWWMSLLSGSRGDAFLGTQGYIWDTQTDMFLALVGGIIGLVLLSRLHDAQLKRLQK